MKTSENSRLRNRAYRSELRGAIKDLKDETNKEEAAVKYKKVASLFDKAANNNLVHKKNADRNKSRLARLVKKLD